MSVSLGGNQKEIRGRDKDEEGKELNKPQNLLKMLDKYTKEDGKSFFSDLT